MLSTAMCLYKMLNEKQREQMEIMLATCDYKYLTASNLSSHLSYVKYYVIV